MDIRAQSRSRTFGEQGVCCLETALGADSRVLLSSGTLLVLCLIRLNHVEWLTLDLWITFCMHPKYVFPRHDFHLG